MLSLIEHQKTLEQVGLSEQESKIYLYLVSHGLSTIHSISNGTKITRTALYPILKEMEAKKIAKQNKTKAVIQYQAESPKSIQQLLKKRQNELEELSFDLDATISKLNSLYAHDPLQPVVFYFEGEGGLQEVNEKYFYKDIFEEQAYFLHPRSLLNQKSFKGSQRNLQLRVKQRITPFVVFTGEEKSEFQVPNGTYIKLNDSLFNINVEIGVIKNRVRIGFLNPQKSIIYIENSALADTLKSLIKNLKS